MRRVGGWTRFTRRCGEIAVAVRGCGSIAIVTAVFIFFMSSDQAAEALRILADPNGPHPTQSVGVWLVYCAVLSLAVYTTSRSTLILPQEASPLINVRTQKVVDRLRTESVVYVGVALTLAGLILVGTAWSLAGAIDFQRDWTDPTSPNLLLVIAAALSAVTSVIVLVFAVIYLTKDHLDSKTIEGDRGKIPVDLKAATWGLLVFFALGYSFHLAVPDYSSAPYVLVFFFGALLAALVLLAELGYKCGVRISAVLVALALLFAAFNLTDNHRIRQAEGTANCGPSTFVPDAFRAWLQSRSDRARFGRYPVFVVAAEGGGMRAAYMALKTMHAFQTRSPAFADHVFAIVGVSGGSLGAAMFAASRMGGNWSLGERAATTALRADLLSPVLAGMLGPDLVARFWPNGLLVSTDRLDRARWIEDALDYAWRQTGQRSLVDVGFGQVWSPDSPRGPALVLLGTRVDTGHRLAISHLRFHDGPQTLCDVAPGLQVPLLTAAFVSARFPLITPAATIASAENDIRVVDGGYFENSGVTTVLDRAASCCPLWRAYQQTCTSSESRIAQRELPYHGASLAIHSPPRSGKLCRQYAPFQAPAMLAVSSQ